MRRIFRNHGLSIVTLGLFFLIFICGQAITGRKQYNEERQKRDLPQLGWADYLRSSHFGEATSENWESEFLQMFVYVVATAFLYQKGSAESKDPNKKHEHKTSGVVTPDSPWPARKGGFVLRLYEHSLSFAFLVLFLIGFVWHARSGHQLYNEERIADGEPAVTVAQYFGSSRFWFESFQNWQSEFLAIGSMVVLTIWLREVNSPESKQVQTPYWENEE
jgi:hypothetical protein